MTMNLKRKEDYAVHRDLAAPHIESFDFFVDAGLEAAMLAIRPVEIQPPEAGKKLRIWFGKPEFQKPTRDGRGQAHDPIFPQECRETSNTYKGRLYAEVYFQYDNGPVIRNKFFLGHIPVMLMSKLCHLRGASPKELVKKKEEATEMGGYFVSNGMERICRFLIIQKRNHPMAVVRKSFLARGEGCTDKAISIRCVREDQSSVGVNLYYTHNGSARVGFWAGRKEYLIPVGIILKALMDSTDHELYVRLTSCYKETNRKVKGSFGTQLVGERAKIIIDEIRDLSLLTRNQCLLHIGRTFQPIMGGFHAEEHSVVGEAVLRDYVLVHLESNRDKFNLLIFMLQKLFALVDQTTCPDNSDALSNQEVLSAGHLLALYLKEKLEVWLLKSQRLILDMMKDSKNFNFSNLDEIIKVMGKLNVMVGKAVESMIRTGKLASRSGLDLPQREGMTIVAERLNYFRFISHFRSVHRGAAFAKMRTTAVRKLLPESWGFLCPVHTPDGTPCGLLNHMTDACRISSNFDLNGNIKDYLKIRMSILNSLSGMGMVQLGFQLEQAAPPEVLHVLLDGCVVGSIASWRIEKVVDHLRKLKLLVSSGIPNDLEVGYVPMSFSGAFPGLYLFTASSRFLRPVRNISQCSVNSPNIELIGPFEQVYMEIRCADGGDGGRKDLFPATHEEIHPTNMLSVVAKLTPWSDHNQSPRNMYQCQMAKQTMGFYSQALQFRADNKAYHLQTPQSPIVRTRAYDKYCLDEFPLGTNAIVAVLAYTGYDMEDAMILNKSSVERGLCRGHIYQTDIIDLEALHAKSDKTMEIFSRSHDASKTQSVDADGLPYVGQMIKPKEPLYSTYNTLTSQMSTTVLKGSEPAFVDYVAVDGTSGKSYKQKVKIRLRRPRNPIIGDKFSSRHGQKGVCSKLWPDIDMPFSAVSGMRPDVIINPHAFPSRMTIAMLLESIAAKGGSLGGKFVDATPFASSTRGEGESEFKSFALMDDLGSLLASKGFNYHGTEVMYSGVFGTELVFEIFIGPVYYQRLRHMVSDKFQVRSTGMVDQVTRQPIGGRKRGGGIRFGEMERDALLAHGTAYLLHDRLHTCSDYHVADVCSLCGSVLTAVTVLRQKRAVREISGLPPGKPSKAFTCHACKTSKGMETVAMPYVFKYLAAELAAMNIKVVLNLSKEIQT